MCVFLVVFANAGRAVTLHAIGAISACSLKDLLMVSGLGTKVFWILGVGLLRFGLRAWVWDLGSGAPKPESRDSDSPVCDESEILSSELR